MYSTNRLSSSLRKETSPKKPHPRMLSRASSDYLDLGRTDDTKQSSQQNLIKSYLIHKSWRFVYLLVYHIHLNNIFCRTKVDNMDELRVDSSNVNEPQPKPDELQLPKTMCNAVVNFIQDEFISSNLKPIIQCHIQRADSRIVG